MNLTDIGLLVITFVCFYLSGYSFYHHITHRIKGLTTVVFLPPVLGLYAFSIVSQYVISYSSNIDLMIVIGFVFSLLGAYFLSKDFLDIGKTLELKKKFLRCRNELLVGVGVLLTVLFLGVNREGRISTLYINGPDGSGYVAAAEHLRTWSGLKNLENLVLEKMSESDLEVAKLNNTKMISNELVSTSEFILKAFRWSFSAVLAATSNLFGIDSSYRLNFIFVAFAYSALFSLSCLGFRKISSLDDSWIPIISGFLVVTNCNLLNVIAQGQYAQTLTSPGFLALLILCFDLRKNSIARIGIREFFTISFLIATFMPFYNEVTLVFGVFLGLIVFFEALTLNFREAVRTVQIWLPPVLVGLLVSFSISAQWIGFLFKHLKNVKIGGWPQPHWAFPSEVLGLSNMYGGNFLLQATERTFFESIWVLFASFFIVVFAAAIFLKANMKTKIYIAAVISFVVGIFLKTKYYELIHSYQYTKAFTFFLPILVILFMAGVWMYCEESRIKFKARFFFFLAAGAMIYQGLSFYQEARKEGRWISESMFALRQMTPKFKTSLLWFPGNELLTTYMITGLIPTNWVNLGVPKLLHQQMDWPILVFTVKRDYPEWKLLKLQARWPIIFENSEFLIHETNYTAQSLYPSGIYTYEEKNAAFIDFQKYFSIKQ